jgi:hypothetical protein
VTIAPFVAEPSPFLQNARARAGADAKAVKGAVAETAQTAMTIAIAYSGSVLDFISGKTVKFERWHATGRTCRYGTTL